jgi:hypothetical protein
MKIKQLIQILTDLNDPEALLEMASDEEGNSFGEISTTIGTEILKENNQKVYTLYPINQEQPENKYVH